MHWPELLLIDKPAGITSFDVIRRLRKEYTTEHGEKAPKMGHAGTLDPLATGLMIIGVGKGTKQLAEYTKLDKEYVAEVLIGRSTTTGDREGDVLEETSIDERERARLDLELVAGTVRGLMGTHRLPVSVYSAIKKDGVPMYKRARAAAKIGDLIKEVPYRDMTIYDAELLSHSYGPIDAQAGLVDGEGVVVGQKISTVNSTNFLTLTIRFHVASGVYIRSLGEELGRQLGYPASLTGLRRTKIGPFSITDARALN